MSADAAIVRVDAVGWTYPHADGPSIRGLDLRIAPGECVVLCGASGSGKSSALRLLNGLIPHFHEGGELSGAVTVAGVDPREGAPDVVGRATGTVLQHPRRQFFADGVAEEVAFASENFGVPPEVIRDRVAPALTALAEVMPIGSRLRDLSGGQQQQVAIAAATAHAPAVLLLDEPSANLSSDAVARLAETLAEQKRRGATIVVAEHRVRYLEDILDRMVVMRDGAVDVVWTAQEFRRVPDDLLAREGLRGRVPVVVLPPADARGASVAPAEAVGVTAGGADEARDLILEGVRCRLGGRLVLALDHARFRAGEVTAIRGVNGAGKSTLVRVVTGLQRAQGTIRRGEQVLSRRRRLRASAVVMQDVGRQLFTESVSAEIALATGGPAADAADVLADLDLTALSSRHPLSLSGGQQQRLVVATARLSGRPIVVFDEPSSGVDRRHLRSIADQIRRVAADGAVVLLVSHDEDLLAIAADRQLTLTPPAEAQSFSSGAGVGAGT